MGKSAKTRVEYSDFYCMKCGNKMTLPRRVSLQRGKHHRKKLYCIHCKQELNFIECRNQWEADEFKENFENEVYKDECQESVEFCN